MRVLGAQEHRRIGEAHGRHEAVDAAVGKVHLALSHTALHGHRLCDAEIGRDGLGDLEPVDVGSAQRVAAVPVEADQLVAKHQRGAIGHRLVQARNEVDGKRIVVVVPNLEAGLVDVLARGIQNGLADLAMRRGITRDDAGLRKIAQQRLQPGQVPVRKAGADQHDEVEIRLGLRLQARQAEMLEEGQAGLHPRGIVEIGPTFLDAVVIDLESAFRRIGKPAKKNGLHDDCPCARVAFDVHRLCPAFALHTSGRALLTSYPTPHIRAPNSTGFLPVLSIYRTGAVKIRAHAPILWKCTVSFPLRKRMRFFASFLYKNDEI